MQTGDPGQTEQQKTYDQALQTVRLGHFTAMPASVDVFGTTTLGWDVIVPTGEFSSSIAVRLNGTYVAREGTSTTGPLMGLSLFTLDATLETASRTLHSIEVAVNTADCRTLTIAAAGVLSGVIKGQVDTQFANSSQYTLKSGGSQVNLADGEVGVVIPLTLNVPDWFDADMTIAIEIAIGGTTALSVGLKDLSADISWSFLDNLASDFCGYAVEKGMSALAKPLLAQIVAAEVVPSFASQLRPLVDNAVNAAGAQDPAHRSFALVGVRLSAAGGLEAVVCPKPAATEEGTTTTGRDGTIMREPVSRL